MKKLINYFDLYYNDVDSVIFKIKEDNDNQDLNMQLFETGCFYGDQKFIRISKRHKTQVIYTIITINNEVRVFSEYTKNSADIIRQINMIKQMVLFDYGIIIEVPMNRDMKGIQETSKIKTLEDDISKQHTIVIKNQNNNYVTYKDGYVWCMGYAPEFIRELVKQKYKLDKKISTEFSFKTLKK